MVPVRPARRFSVGLDPRRVRAAILRPGWPADLPRPALCVLRGAGRGLAAAAGAARTRQLAGFASVLVRPQTSGSVRGRVAVLAKNVCFSSCGVLTFILADLLLNSRFGSAISEAIVESVVLLYRWLRFDLVQGLLRWVNRFFKQVTASVEYVLYTVDEWLRFRSDESRLMLGLRAILGVVWFPIGYFIRFYFVTLLEPTLNPLKLPFSSLAFKLMWLIPLYRQLLDPRFHEGWLTQYLGVHLSWVLAFAVIMPTFWLFPGVFAFFAWEMQADWRLFRANRPKRLKPVVVGRHGETMLQLLKPGFHSGTIPSLFSNLRRAERDAYLTDDWRPAAPIARRYAKWPGPCSYLLRGSLSLSCVRATACRTSRSAQCKSFCRATASALSCATAAIPQSPCGWRSRNTRVG